MRIGVGLSIPELATRGGRFSPASLFTSGVVGAWYDPSDYSTLFQDSAGTTPVTAVEQPVGLMLDKSQGLVLGSEILTNGGFATDTDWTKGAGVTISGGTMNFSAATSNTFQREATEDNSGKVYEYTIVVSSVSGGNLVVGLNSSPPGSADFPAITAAGTYTYRRRYTGTTAYLYLVAAGFTGSIDSVSCKVVAGNHALQATAASRPVLRARYNLLTYSEQFDNAAWVLSAATVTANSTTAPDGTTTADTITFSSVAGRVQRAVNMASQCISIYAKPIVGTRFAINTDGVSGADATIFNLSGSGSVVSTGANNNSSVITALADGWYRIVTARGSTAGTNIYLGALNSGGGSTDSFYIWGADLRTGSSAGTYQRIAAATDYATAGFLPYLALSTDDSFATNSIDFTATDKMSVCAGVTKLSDAASAMLVELSANAVLNAGSFNIQAPVTGGNAEYRYGGGGTIFRSILTSGYAAPITNVLAATQDIVGDAMNLRVNGVSVGTSALDQGAGNFGNYPLYIGRRNNASLPFEGRIYGLIVCGKMLSASELSSTESWMNSRTGAY
jgi:hypothetical protein